MVVGLASSLPLNKPSIMAEPVETRILSGIDALVINEHRTFLESIVSNLVLYLSLPKTEAKRNNQTEPLK